MERESVKHAASSYRAEKSRAVDYGTPHLTPMFPPRILANEDCGWSVIKLRAATKGDLV